MVGMDRRGRREKRPGTPTGWASGSNPSSGVATAAGHRPLQGVNEVSFPSFTRGIHLQELDPRGDGDRVNLAGLGVKDPRNHPTTNRCSLVCSVVLVLHQPSSDPLSSDPGAPDVRDVHHKRWRGRDEAHGDPVIVHVLMLPHSWDRPWKNKGAGTHYRASVTRRDYADQQEDQAQGWRIAGLRRPCGQASPISATTVSEDRPKRCPPRLPPCSACCGRYPRAGPAAALVGRDPARRGSMPNHINTLGGRRPATLPAPRGARRFVSSPDDPAIMIMQGDLCAAVTPDRSCQDRDLWPVFTGTPGLDPITT